MNRRHLIAVLFVAAALAVVALQGLRWQIYGLLVAFGIAALLALFQQRRWIFATGLTMALAATTLSALALWGFRPLELPAPGGTYLVGTTVAYWTDESRPEDATRTKDDHRRVTAQIWYPTDTAGSPARYLGSTRHEAELVGEGLSDLFGAPSFLLSEAVKGHGQATLNAPLAAKQDRFGVVVFSPGLLGVRTQNTAWAQFLAARGYVVAALDHPYDSAMTVTREGEPIRSRVRATGNQAQDQATTDRVTAIRAADLSFALDRLTTDPGFAGRLDPDRTVAAGHSAGGAAALQAAAQDERFRAAIDIDGLPRNGARPEQPVLALVAGDGTGDEQNDAEYQATLAEVLAASSNGKLVTVPDTKHLSFTDAPFLLPRLPMLFGSADPEQAYAATTEATLSFLTTDVPARGASPR